MPWPSSAGCSNILLPPCLPSDLRCLLPQVQSSQSSAAAGTSGMSASPIACLTTAITMADQMQTMLEKVRGS